MPFLFERFYFSYAIFLLYMLTYFLSPCLTAFHFSISLVQEPRYFLLSFIIHNGFELCYNRIFCAYSSIYPQPIHFPLRLTSPFCFSTAPYSSLTGVFCITGYTVFSVKDLEFCISHMRLIDELLSDDSIFKTP